MATDGSTATRLKNREGPKLMVVALNARQRRSGTNGGNKEKDHQGSHNRQSKKLKRND